MTEKTISKILSANDTGETGGHQAGLLIPKEERILSFFPTLDKTKLNPRSHLQFQDMDGRFWEFAFIYYNNKFFNGTRNEYRLTRMTRYIRQAGLRAGDEVFMRFRAAEGYSISYQRKSAKTTIEKKKTGTVLRLGSGWKIIDF